MNHPLVSVVLAYAAGLLLGQFCHPPLVALFATSYFVFILTLIVKNFRQPLLWLLFALAGWTNLACRTTVISPDDLQVLLGNEPAIVSVRGVTWPFG